MRIGISVECAVCHRTKAPRGRSLPCQWASSRCDWDCPGYRLDPQAGSLFPGETEAEFGFPIGPEGTREMTEAESSAKGGDDGR